MKRLRNGVGKAGGKGGVDSTYAAARADKDEERQQKQENETDDVEWLKATNRLQAREIRYLKQELEELHMKLLKAERRIRELVAKTAVSSIAGEMSELKKPSQSMEGCSEEGSESEGKNGGDKVGDDEAHIRTKFGVHVETKGSGSGLGGERESKYGNGREDKQKQQIQRASPDAIARVNHGAAVTQADNNAEYAEIGGTSGLKFDKSPASNVEGGPCKKLRTYEKSINGSVVEVSNLGGVNVGGSPFGQPQQSLAKVDDFSSSLSIPSGVRLEPVRNAAGRNTEGENSSQVRQATLSPVQKLCEWVGETGDRKAVCFPVASIPDACQHVSAGRIFDKTLEESPAFPFEGRQPSKVASVWKTSFEDCVEQSRVGAVSSTPSASGATTPAIAGDREKAIKLKGEIDAKSKAKLFAAIPNVLDINKSPPADIAEFLTAACTKAAMLKKDRGGEGVEKTSAIDMSKSRGISAGIFGSLLGGSTLRQVAATEANKESSTLGNDGPKGRGRVLHLLQEQCRMLEEKKAAKTASVEGSGRDRQPLDLSRSAVNLSAERPQGEASASRSALPMQERQFLEVAAARGCFGQSSAGGVSHVLTVNRGFVDYHRAASAGVKLEVKGEDGKSVEMRQDSGVRVGESMGSPLRAQPGRASHWAATKPFVPGGGESNGIGSRSMRNGGVFGGLLENSNALQPQKQLDWANLFEHYSKLGAYGVSTLGKGTLDIEQFANNSSFENALFSWGARNGLGMGLNVGEINESHAVLGLHGGDKVEEVKGGDAGLSLRCGTETDPHLASSPFASHVDSSGESAKRKRTYRDGDENQVMEQGRKASSEHFLPARDDGGPENWTLGMGRLEVEAGSRKGEESGNKAKMPRWGGETAPLSLREEELHLPKLTMGLAAHSMESPKKVSMSVQEDSILQISNAGKTGREWEGKNNEGPSHNFESHSEAPRDRGSVKCVDFWAPDSTREAPAPADSSDMVKPYPPFSDEGKERENEKWQNKTECGKSKFADGKESNIRPHASGSPPLKHSSEQSEEKAATLSILGEVAGGSRGGQAATPPEIEPRTCSEKTFLSEEQWENLKLLALGEYEKKKGRPHVVKGALHYGRFLEECVEWAPGVWLSASVLLGAYHRWAHTHSPPSNDACIKNLQQQAMILGPLALNLRKKHFHCGSRLRTVGMNYRGITLRYSALPATTPSFSLLSGAMEGETDTDTYADDDTVDDDGMSEMHSERSRTQSTREEEEKTATNEGFKAARIVSFVMADSHSDGLSLLRGSELADGETPAVEASDASEKLAEISESSCKQVVGTGSAGGEGEGETRRGEGGEGEGTRNNNRNSPNHNGELACSSSRGRSPAPLKVEGVISPSAFGPQEIPSCLRRILTAVGCKSVPEIRTFESPLLHRKEAGTNSAVDGKTNHTISPPRGSVSSPTRSDEYPCDETHEADNRDGLSESVCQDSRQMKIPKSVQKGFTMPSPSPFPPAPRGVGKGAVRLGGSMHGPIGVQIGTCADGSVEGQSQASAVLPKGGSLGKGRPPGSASGAPSANGSATLVRPAATRVATVGCGAEEGKLGRW